MECDGPSRGELCGELSLCGISRRRGSAGGGAAGLCGSVGEGQGGEVKQRKGERQIEGLSPVFAIVWMEFVLR